MYVCNYVCILYILRFLIIEGKKNHINMNIKIIIILGSHSVMYFSM